MQVKKLWVVGVFAVAMAYLESAVVVYLRRVFDIQDLILDTPLARFDPQIAGIEVGRELATLVMLLALGWALGKTRQARLGFAVFAFGVWDIFYYFWLRVFIGWPITLLDPDILFLFPLPWWGPVLSPMLVALVMIVGGGLAVAADDKGHAIRFSASEWGTLVAGVALILYAFMQDAIGALPVSAETLSHLMPTEFNWGVYLAGLGLGGYAVWRVTWPGVRG